jgi:hypothetical protein
VRKLTCIIAILIAVVLLFGCAVNKETENPLQSASGGSANTANNTNLKDINITTDGDETVVKLSFLSGSRKAGYAESKLLSVPEYTVEQLSSPQRIMITLQGISFWDYEQKASWALSDFLLGLFQEAPAANDSLILYLQLSNAAEFNVDESEGDLVIRLKPANAQSGLRYYCVSNSFFEHQEGTWPQSINMQPVLCSDLENKLLISQPFNTMEEAESYRDSINSELQRALPGNSLSVIGLNAGVLPDYTDIDFSAAENKSVVMKDGEAADTPLLLQNGRYLATAPDGRIAFSRSYRPEEPALSQDEYLDSEKLWILDTSGRVKSVDTTEPSMVFYTIDSAQFSYDSRYICLKDVSIENSVLYVYDFNTKALFNLGEEGFGNQTAAFAWSDTGDTLYAMTGYGDALQMLSCTFADDGGHSINAVEEEPGAIGQLCVSQGTLFFADSYAGVIYQIGETRTELTRGMDFAVSPEGDTMAVLETSVSDSEQVLTNLKLYDIVTGEYRVITENADIASFGFSPNGSKVYYTDAAIGDEAVEGYEYGLFAYDIGKGEKSMLALCSTGDVAMGASGSIYLIQFFDEAANSFYATYQYNLA